MLLSRAGSPLLVFGLAALLGCEDASLVELEARLEADEVVDFGRVSVGVFADAKLELAATGELPVRFTSFEIDPPSAPVRLVARPDVLPTGGRGAVELRYRPLRAGPLEAVLRIRAGPGDALEVPLRGEGIENALEVSPDPVAFGVVRLGDARRVSVEVVNRSGAPVTLRLPVDQRGRVSLDDQGAFSVVSLLGPRGRVGNGPLAPGEGARLELAFSPRRVGEARGALVLRFCDQPLCEQTVRLSGTGVDVGLRCEPAAIDFGFVDPRNALTRRIECSNPTHRALSLLAPVLDGPDAGRFEGILTATRLPARGQVSFPITVRPEASDDGRELAARFAVEAVPESGRAERAEVALRARVARAEIRVLPERIELGPVAVGVEVRRTLVVANVGERDVAIDGVEIPPPFVGGSPRRVLGPGDTLSVEVALTPSAPGRVSGTARVRVDDAELVDVEVPLEAEALLLPPCRISLVPSRLDYGVVPVLSRTRRSVVITNDAAHVCLIRDPTVSGDAFVAVPLERSLAVGPGETARIEAEFRPPRAGEHRGALRLQVSDPTDPVREVPLFGASGEGDLRVDPNRLDFGQVRPGCTSAVRELRLANLGSAPLFVGRAFSTSGEFVVEGAPAGFPAPPGAGLSIPAGSIVSMQVRFQPAGLGEAAPAVLRVEEAGALAPQLVDLVGRAASGSVVERFEQRAAAEVDVLFVIDNSLSMAQEQASVIANAGRFLARLDDAGADYRVAVISTDMDAPECRVPRAQRPPTAPQGACGWFADGDAASSDPAWSLIDPADAPSPQAAFSHVANLGLSGSAREEGLAAALRATSPRLVGGHNAGFLRPDAALAFVFISDEEDQSPRVAEAYVAAFRALKGAGRPEQLSASSVITTGVPCAIETGARYRAVSDALGGIVRSICTSDWARVVSELAERALGLRTRFELAQPPAPGTAEVRVDGASVPPRRGGQDQWSIEAGSRRLVFAPEARPDIGATIEVEYEPACP